LGSFVLGGVSFANLFKKPATKMYPKVQPAYTPMTKGHIVNDIEACTLCGVCAKKCPSDAIVVDKPGRAWSIDPFACIQCNNCVRACPQHCMTMAIQYTSPSTTKEVLTLIKPEKEEVVASGAVVEPAVAQS